MSQIKKITFLCFIFCLFQNNLVSGQIMRLKDVYRKVSSTLPEDLVWTKLIYHDTKPTQSINLSCLNRCSREKRCNLVCYNDTICSLYKTIVSVFWDPNGPRVHNALVTLNSVCFTSWVFERDITTQIIRVRAATVYYNFNLIPMNSINGVHAYTWLTNGYFALHSTDHWIEYEFDSEVWVSTLLVKVEYFTDVSAFIGHEPSVAGNYSSFTYIGNSEDAGARNGELDGELVTYSSSHCLRGKFVALTSFQNVATFFGVSDFKVLGCK